MWSGIKLNNNSYLLGWSTTTAQIGTSVTKVPNMVLN